MTAREIDGFHAGEGIIRTVTPGRTGGDVRTIGAGNFAGHEIDFTTNWKLNSNLSVKIDYSHFFASDYLRDTGTHSDADFGYLQATPSCISHTPRSPLTSYLLLLLLL